MNCHRSLCLSFVGVLKDNLLGERDRGDIITQHRERFTVCYKTDENDT